MPHTDAPQPAAFLELCRQKTTPLLDRAVTPEDTQSGSWHASTPRFDPADQRGVGEFIQAIHGSAEDVPRKLTDTDVASQIGEFIQAIHGSDEDVPRELTDTVFDMIHCHWEWMNILEYWQYHDSFLATLALLKVNPQVCRLLGHLVKHGHWPVFSFHSLMVDTRNTHHAILRTRALKKQIRRLAESIERHTLETCAAVCLDICRIESECRTRRKRAAMTNNFFPFPLADLIDCADHMGTEQFQALMILLHTHSNFFTTLGRKTSIKCVTDIGKLPVQNIEAIGHFISVSDTEQLLDLGFDKHAVVEFWQQVDLSPKIDQTEDNAIAITRQLIATVGQPQLDALGIAACPVEEFWQRKDSLGSLDSTQNEAAAITDRINKNIQKYLRRFDDNHVLLAAVIHECDLRVIDFNDDVCTPIEEIIEVVGGIKKLAHRLLDTSSNNSRNGP